MKHTEKYQTSATVQSVHGLCSHKVSGSYEVAFTTAMLKLPAPLSHPFKVMTHSQSQLFTYNFGC